MIQLLHNIFSLQTLQRKISSPSLGHGIIWNRPLSMGRTCPYLTRAFIGPHTHESRLNRGFVFLQEAGRLSLVLLLLLSFSTQAQVTQSVTKGSRPLWEGGVALVSARVPAYPGADQYNHLTLPFPSFFYRGDLLRADEEGGMRGRFFKNDTFEINLSIGGSLPASSDDNGARQGMPDLNTMVELGPGLLATLWQKRGKQSFKLGINIPLRSAIAVDLSSVKERGLVFNPLLYFITENWLAKGIFTFTSISSVVASYRFHKVFYDVDAQFATASRPEYQADSGYLSTTLSQGFSTRLYKDMMGFFGISYSNYSGAANRHSPLMKQRDNFNMALGLVWWFYKSDSKEQRI